MSFLVACQLALAFFSLQILTWFAFETSETKFSLEYWKCLRLAKRGILEKCSSLCGSLWKRVLVVCAECLSLLLWDGMGRASCLLVYLALEGSKSLLLLQCWSNSSSLPTPWLKLDSGWKSGDWTSWQGLPLPATATTVIAIVKKRAHS